MIYLYSASPVFWFWSDSEGGNCASFPTTITYIQLNAYKPGVCLHISSVYSEIQNTQKNAHLHRTWYEIWFWLLAAVECNDQKLQKASLS